MQFFSLYLSKIHLNLSVEKVQQSIVLIFILSIVAIASVGLCRPISIKQYQVVFEIANQNRFEESKLMAERLLEAEHVKNIQFYRLLNAYHSEQDKVTQYDSVKIESTVN